MKFAYFFLLLSLCLITSLHKTSPNPIVYPKTKLSTQKDTIFNKIIKDPYRWLENQNSSSVKSWITKQNSLTSSYLRKIPFSRKIKKSLKNQGGYPKHGIPFKKGKYAYNFYTGPEGDLLYMLDESKDNKKEIIINFNSTLFRGKYILKDDIFISNDNRYLAYAIIINGSDLKSIEILDLKNNKLLNDKIESIKFGSISWKGNGFYYTKYSKTKNKGLPQNIGVFFHKLGTPQEADELIYQNVLSTKTIPFIVVSENERFLFLYKFKGSYGNSISYRDTWKSENNWVSILSNCISEIEIICHIDDKFIAITDDNSPYRKVVKIDPNYPQRENWETIIEGTEKLNLDWIRISNKRIVAHFSENVLSKIKIYDFSGNYINDVHLPDEGVVEGFFGNTNDTKSWYSFSNFISPTNIYEYDFLNNTSKVYKSSQSQFKKDEYIFKKDYYFSYDSTQIPIFIALKKGLLLNNKNPTILYSYGGFNVTMRPSFDDEFAFLLENNCAVALANIRGGNEYGTGWHDEGKLFKKQNVFNDFFYASDYLFKNGYTNPDYLAIEGKSNGGLLIGSVINQFPYICRVSFIESGLLDMIRYEKLTFGQTWTDEYGSVNDKDNFTNLLSYSPIHNIEKKNKYPSILILTGDNDERVAPSHSYKYTAVLQNRTLGKNPVLLRSISNTGHSKFVKNSFEKWSFMFYEMGIPF
tara:strand:- start:4300 stop:6387 length:2088 start_codon:yes stop_codon:yes gene_type:complete